MVSFIEGLYFVLIWCFTQGSVFENIRVMSKNQNVLLQFIDNNDVNSFEIQYNLRDIIGNTETFEDCSVNVDQYCRKYTEETYLIIDKLNEYCVTVNYSSNVQDSLIAEINLTGLHLYGGAEHMISEWPVDKVKYVENPYVTKNEYYQAILEPYWLTSKGHYVYVDNAVPLFISVYPTKRVFQLIAKKAAPYVKKNLELGLNFSLCKFKNVRVAHEHAIKHFLGKPKSLPDIRRVKLPIWSSWVKYKENINEELTFNYAKEIANHGYGGQVEIDDNWESCYGSLIPDKNKFPDLKNLVSKLKQLNFTVTIWVHPFVNLNCEPTHSIGLQYGYFVQNYEGATTTRWWRGNASYVDFTNPKAVKWFLKRLRKLRSAYNIDSFKFDGGESGYSPQLAKYHVMTKDHPETIVKEYVKMIASIGTNVHTRVARGTQEYPIFVTMMDRESDWKKNLGLPTLITQLLQMNVLGYSFVLPDMIGGNFYGVKANSELFIRWLQANVFMPSLQFSVPPWDYGPELSKLAKKFVNLHVKYSQKIIELMQKNVETGAPVNPPLWWIAPEDPEALICDSEFLLGEDILIAPVLKENARSRDIYLPDGYWKDENVLTEPIIKGPIWLKNYKADLSVLPYFKKVPLSSSVLLIMNMNDESLNDSLSFGWFTIFLLLICIFMIVYTVFKMCRRYFRRKRYFGKY